MSFVFIILIRLLFVACMVFIMGYVFGSFSKNLVLTRITKVAAVLAIVLFFLSNVFVMRSAWESHGSGTHERGWCGHNDNDSTAVYSKDF